MNKFSTLYQVEILNTVDEATLLLEEYKALKAEQLNRINSRDHLNYLAIGLFVAVATIGYGENGKWILETFLFIPWVNAVLGWSYLTNDQKVSAIGRYIRNEMTKRLSALSNDGVTFDGLFRWELIHRSDKNRKSRKILQLGNDLLVFVLTGIAAVFFYWSKAPHFPNKILIVSFSVIPVAVIAWQIIIYADLRVGLRSLAEKNDVDL